VFKIVQFVPSKRASPLFVAIFFIDPTISISFMKLLGKLLLEVVNTCEKTEGVVVGRKIGSGSILFAFLLHATKKMKNSKKQYVSILFVIRLLLTTLK